VNAVEINTADLGLISNPSELQSSRSGGKRISDKQPSGSLGARMERTGMLMKKGKSIVLAAAAAVASLLGTSALRPAHAAVITLTDKNSSITINPDSEAGVNGLNKWTVNGVNQINQEWFWYRVGSTGGQTSINNLNIVGTPTVLDTTGDSQPDYTSITYADPANTFQLTTTYSLSGGLPGSKASDVGETIKIVNTSASTLNYHFYQYSNFNLGGSASGQNVSITGGNTATQTSPGSLMVSQTVVSPTPNEFQAGAFPSLVNALNGGTPLTLNDTATAAGDGEWAYQWDLVLNPGASFVISADKQISAAVPEPTSSLAVLALGGLFLTRPRRRDEDADPRTAQVAEA
jgi:hypothetical protein